MKEDNRSIVVDINNLEEYKQVFELLDVQLYRAGYDKLSSSGGGGIEIREGLSGIKCVLSKQEFNSEYNRMISFSELKELVNNKGCFSIAVRCDNLCDWREVLEIMNSQQDDGAYSRYQGRSMYIEVTPDFKNVWSTKLPEEVDREKSRRLTLSEFKELVNNKKDLINNKIIMNKKEKKFKKGTVTTTKEVTKKVPKPKYKLLTEQYLLHDEDSSPEVLTYTYARYENGEWKYTVNHHTGCIQGESYIDKHLIK